MRKKNYLISGFTLIELLVAMGILALVATSSVAIIGNFNRRQAINIAYDDVKNALAQAKSYALSQVVSGCKVKDPIAARDELVGYKVTFNNSVTPKTYSVSEVCRDPSNALITITPAVKTYSLPSQVSFGTFPADGVTFKVLRGGADTSQPITITITASDGQSKSITVNPSGDIR